MANSGVIPIDPTTNVGRLRFRIPDSEYVEVTPTEGDFTWFSDAALSVLLEAADDDVDTALAEAWGQIADFYASEAVSVTTDDLRVDLTKRAQFWRDKADAAVIALNGDVFALASLGRSCGCRCHAELAGWWNCGACSCS